MLEDSHSLRAQGVLDHVCLAVRRIAPAGGLIQRILGYDPRTSVVANSRQMVNVQFYSKVGSIDIKLIEPTSPKSPLNDFLRRRGPGLHHLGFLAPSVVSANRELRNAGIKVLAGPEPGEAFDDESILFAYLNCGLNLEIIDTPARRGLL